MKFLFVLGYNEQDWANDLRQDIVNKIPGSESTLVSSVSEAIELLNAHDREIDHVISGTLHDDWLILGDALGEKPEIKMHLLTGSVDAQVKAEAQRRGVGYIWKSDYSRISDTLYEMFLKKRQGIEEK